ncbi:MAG: O-antigen ligase family protein [Leptolyngbyaceae cyanobacterium]
MLIEEIVKPIQSSVIQPIQDFVRPVFQFADSERFERLERIFLIFYLIVYSGGILVLILSGGASEGDGTDSSNNENYGIITLFFLVNYLATSGLFLLKWREVQKRIIPAIFGNYFYWIFYLMIPLSIIWSDRPSETESAAIAMTGTMMFALYLATRFSAEDRLKLFVQFFGTVIVLSILMVILMPSYGLETAKHAGAIRGIYGHKNIFGPTMTFSCVTFLIYLKSSFSHKKFAWAGLVLSCFLLVGSRSSSSLLYTCMLFSLVLFFETFRWDRQKFILSTIFFVAAAFFVAVWGYTIFEFVLGLLGKDTTLTGRTEIWPVIIDKIEQRPWLGYGFNGFWHGKYGESLYVEFALRWKVPNSHNGFLDLTLTMGLVGISLVALAAWSSFIKGLATIWESFRWEYVWPVVMICNIGLINMSESSLAIHNNIFTVFMTFAFASTAINFSETFLED